MKNVKILVAVIAGIILSAMCSPFVQAEDDWKFYTAPGLWAAGVDTKLEAGSITLEGDVDFADLIESLKGGVMGELGAQKGKLSIDSAYMVMGLEDDIPAVIGALGDRTLEMDMVIAQVMVGYDLVEVPVGDEMKLTITPSVGPRYFYNRIVIDQLNGGELRDNSGQWVDFTTGLAANLDINEKFGLLVKGSAGGFGWGDSSEMVWSVGGFVDYHIKDWSTLRAGYLHMDIEKEKTAHFGDVKIDLAMSGPVVEWIIGF